MSLRGIHIKRYPRINAITRQVSSSLFASAHRPISTGRTRFRMNEDSEVSHDKNNSCFFIKLNDGGKALLEYESSPDKILDFYHTEVPSNQQGKGIAKHLVKAAIEYAFENNFLVKPTCSYVLKYVNENLENEQRDKIIR